MSVLRTYQRRLDPTGSTRWPLYSITEGGHVKRQQGTLAPGELVCHDTGLDSSGRGMGRGMVVAVCSEEVAVLWSVEPTAALNLKYDPLAYDDDIWVPVNASAPAYVPCPSGCRCERCKREADDTSWFTKQLQRVLGRKKP